MTDPDKPLYILFYEEYTEYTQFEGSWDRGWTKFHTLESATQAKAALSLAPYYRNMEMAKLL